MKKFKSTVIIVTLVAVLASLVSIPANAESSYKTYTYSYDGDIQISPNAYAAQYEISDFGLETPLNKPKDMVTDNEGKRIFVADTSNNRIVVLNSDLNVITTIAGYPGSDGEMLNFSEPEGVFYSSDEQLYVADTNNTNIVVFDSSYNYIRTIYAPSSDSFPSDFTYKPKAISVDSTGRIYVISLNTNMGVITLDKKGNFQSFIGAQRVSTTLVEIVKRMFMSKEQIERSASFVPMEYSNLTIDSKGFVYVTSEQIERYNLYSSVWSRSSDSTYAPIKKINPSGTDVLRRNGFFPPVGDILFDAYDNVDEDEKIDPSQFSEIALLDNGMYSLVDSDGNKIFTYDSYGNLLYAFGGNGESLGLFNQLATVQYIGDKMYALDTLDGSITVLTKTDYGKMIDEVISYQENRQFDKEREIWQGILDQNNNFDLAYYGIGKTYLEDGKYEQAMEYFKLISNKTYYSRAYKLLRQEKLEKYGLLVMVLIVALIVGIAAFLGFAGRYNNKRRFEPASGKLRDELMFAFYAMFHPFNGFYEIKHEKRGSGRAASIILGTGVVTYILKDFACGYLQKSDSSASLISSMANILLPVALRCIANWCLTSLMDGNGKAKDIYIATCYSLMPLILVYIVTTFAGHFLIQEELSFLTFAINIFAAWTIILVILSMMTIHEYSFGRNALTCVLSLVVVGIILFLLMIFFSLSGRIVSLVNNIINEISFRM